MSPTLRGVAKDDWSAKRERDGEERDETHPAVECRVRAIDCETL